MFDEDDIKILKEFSKLKLSNGGVSSWNMTKKIYGKCGDKEYKKIKRKLEFMKDLGLFTFENHSFILDANKVKLRIFSFSSGRKECVEILIDGKYQVFEL